MEKFTPLATNFTLPPGLTGWTNFTSGHNLVDNYIDRLFEPPRLVQPVYRGRLLRDVMIGEKNSLGPRATRFKLVRLVPELQFNGMLGWVRKPTS